MSLLRWKTNADVTVYQEEEYVDADGNIMLRPSNEGVVTRAEIQPARQSGTSARRAEQDDEGFITEENYRMRFTRAWEDSYGPLGQAAQVEWKGSRWSVIGLPDFYNGSRRTRHIDYMIRRA